MDDDALPPKSKVEFDRLIARLRKVRGLPDPVRKGFGTRALFVETKMFAHLDDDGNLVFRLPADRSDALIVAGTGTGWGVRAGQSLRGYLSVPVSRSDEWFALSREAQAHAVEKAGTKPPKKRSKA
jgi:hypothetical protein